MLSSNPSAYSTRWNAARRALTVASLVKRSAFFLVSDYGPWVEAGVKVLVVYDDRQLHRIEGRRSSGLLHQMHLSIEIGHG